MTGWTRVKSRSQDPELITAHAADEACALYRERRDEIRLVLTDMMMPSMDGAAAIRELRRLNPNLPIIAGSGLADVGREAQARSLGAQLFLSKPYKPVRVLRALDELLRGDHADSHHERGTDETHPDHR